jgi:DNA-binding transcriptional regulator YiaG
MIMLKPEDIRAIREAMKMGPGEFAKFLGVHRMAVYFWERGTNRPRWDMMERLNELGIKAGVIRSVIVRK